MASWNSGSVPLAESPDIATSLVWREIDEPPALRTVIRAAQRHLVDLPRQRDHVETPPVIHVVLGTTRRGRFSQKVGCWLLDRLSARTDMAVELVDLRDHPLPVYERRIPPACALRDYPDPDIARWGATVDRADGYLFVTAEYNHGYPATLKNAIDHAFCEFQRKQAAFVGYGNVGGARAIEQLRLVCVELEMAPLRHAVHVLPELMRPIMQVDTVEQDHFASLDPRLDLLATDVAW